MVRGTCGPADVNEASFSNPEIQRLARSMVIRESDTYNAAFPAKRIADVTLVLQDGRELNSGPTEALGDPENPVPLETVVSKYRAYAAPVLGQARMHEIETQVLSLAEGDDLASLLALLTEAV